MIGRYRDLEYTVRFQPPSRLQFKIQQTKRNAITQQRKKRKKAARELSTQSKNLAIHQKFTQKTKIRNIFSLLFVSSSSSSSSIQTCLTNAGTVHQMSHNENHLLSLANAHTHLTPCKSFLFFIYNLRADTQLIFPNALQYMRLHGLKTCFHLRQKKSQEFFLKSKIGRSFISKIESQIKFDLDEATELVPNRNCIGSFVKY